MCLRVSGTGCCLGPGSVPDIFPGVASRGAVYLQVTSQLLKLSLTRLSKAQWGPAVGLSACPVPHGASQQTTMPMLGAVILCNRLLLKHKNSCHRIKKNKAKKNRKLQNVNRCNFCPVDCGISWRRNISTKLNNAIKSISAPACASLTPTLPCGRVEGGKLRCTKFTTEQV